jgi:RNA recognition motif-containing protein
MLFFQNPEDAVKALTSLSGLPVSNKRIKVSYSRPNTADIRQGPKHKQQHFSLRKHTTFSSVKCAVFDKPEYDTSFTVI